MEKGTNKPIESADVLLLKKGEVIAIADTFSESEGNFHLFGIDDGEYSLMVRLIEYNIYINTPVVLHCSEPVLDLGIIELQSLEIGLTEVVVEGYKRQIIYKLDKKIIDASNNLMGSGGTAVDIPENTPSVRVGPDGEVIFRGSGVYFCS